MPSIRDFVMEQPLLCHHDHHVSYHQFDAGRHTYDFSSLLSYATADLVTAEGTRPAILPMGRERIERLWPKIRLTGYGRAVTLGCRALFGLEYGPATFDAVTEALQASIAGKSAAEVYHDYVHAAAQNVWTIHDYIDDEVGYLPRAAALNPHLYPGSYRFTLRLDRLFYAVDQSAITMLEAFCRQPVYTLDQCVARMNDVVDRYRAGGRLAALKIAVSYLRDLSVSDPTHYEAELAFNRIRSRKVFWGGVQQPDGAVDAATARPLGDYLLHRLLQRASDDDLPVQVHTGYLEGNWRPLDGTQALHLLPLFDKYRSVRFDVFHASWPWSSEMGAIAKSYPNVWLNMCWAWAMNPGQAARALSEWLDCVPFNKIFAYGADTWLPWGNVGYSLQAKQGIATVLEGKIERGDIGEADAEEVATAIMLENGAAFYGLRPSGA